MMNTHLLMSFMYEVPVLLSLHFTKNCFQLAVFKNDIQTEMQMAILKRHQTIQIQTNQSNKTLDAKQQNFKKQWRNSIFKSFFL